MADTITMAEHEFGSCIKSLKMGTDSKPVKNHLDVNVNETILAENLNLGMIVRSFQTGSAHLKQIKYSLVYFEAFNIEYCKLHCCVQFSKAYLCRTVGLVEYWGGQNGDRASRQLFVLISSFLLWCKHGVHHFTKCMNTCTACVQEITQQNCFGRNNAVLCVERE